MAAIFLDEVFLVNAAYFVVMIASTVLYEASKTQLADCESGSNTR